MSSRKTDSTLDDTGMHILQHPRAMDYQSACPLFRFPRELRDIIYIAYIKVPGGGYLFDADASKVVQADGGGRIDVRLLRACQKINQEMECMPLGHNKVTFRNLCTPEMSMPAGVLHATLHHIEAGRWNEVCQSGALLT